MISFADFAALPKGKKPTVNKIEKPQTSNFRPLDPKLIEYFANRGISKRTLERNRVAQEHTWMPGQPAGAAIAFPYLRNGEVVNVKYRTMDKCFRQVKGAEKILYGLDDVVGQDTIIIVEGPASHCYSSALTVLKSLLALQYACTCAMHELKRKSGASVWSVSDHMQHAVMKGIAEFALSHLQKLLNVSYAERIAYG